MHLSSVTIYAFYCTPYILTKIVWSYTMRLCFSITSLSRRVCASEVQKVLAVAHLNQCHGQCTRVQSTLIWQSCSWSVMVTSAHHMIPSYAPSFVEGLRSITGANKSNVILLWIATSVWWSNKRCVVKSFVQVIKGNWKESSSIDRGCECRAARYMVSPLKTQILKWFEDSWMCIVIK